MKQTAVLSVLAAVAATPAFATTVPVPEPSMIGLAAAGAVGVIVAYRLRKGK